MKKKTMADWLEKISAGAMLVGLFQDDKGAGAIAISMIVLGLCLYFRRKERRHD